MTRVAFVTGGTRGIGRAIKNFKEATRKEEESKKIDETNKDTDNKA